MELQLFENGRQPVTSRHFCLKSCKKLSHHLNAQFFHSSLNLSEESIHVCSLGVLEPVLSLRQRLLKILTLLSIPLLKGSEGEAIAHVFVLIEG